MYCTKKGKRNRSVRDCICFISATNANIRGEMCFCFCVVVRILQEASGVVDLIIFLHKCEIRLEFSIGK